MWDLAARARSALERSALLLVATTYYHRSPRAGAAASEKKMDTWSCARLADWLMTHEGMMKACGHDLALVASDDPILQKVRHHIKRNEIVLQSWL